MMRNKMKKMLALLCASVMIATAFFSHWYTEQAKAATDAKPVWLEGYEYLTIKDFEDTSGNKLTAPGTLNAGGGYKTHTTTEVTGFDNVLLSMKVTFGGGSWSTKMEVAGTGSWEGLQIQPSNAAGDELYIISAKEDNSGHYGTTDEARSFAITPTEAGVTKFVGEELLLQLAFDFGEVNPATNKADLKLDVYINGNLCKSQTFTGCNMNKFGNYLNFYSASSGSAITYDNVIPPIKPVFPDGYKYVTIKDFEGLSAGTFQAGAGTKVYSAFNLTNFDNVLLSMKLKLTGTVGTWHTRVIIGGNATNAHDGFALCLAKNDGSELQLKNWVDSSLNNITVTAKEAGVNDFFDEFLLQLALNFEVTDVETNKAKLTVDIYVNGELCKNGIIEGCDMTKMGNRLAFYSQADGGTITYDNVIAPIEPAKLEGFDNLTISDFTDSNGNTLVEGEYQASETETFKNYSVSGLDNFDNKLLSMNVHFKGGTWANSIIIAGKSGWFGFDLHPSSDGSKLEFGTTRASSITSSSTPSLSATTAQIGSFLNNEFLLQIGFELGQETDGMVDLKLHVYIDGKLYNNEILTIKNCTKSALASNVAVYLATAQSGGKSIIVGKEVEFPITPVEPEDPFEGYTEVTIKDFVNEKGKVMQEKAYTCLNPISGTFDGFNLANHDSFDGKVLSMNVKFKEGGATTRIDVAGKTKWKGLQVYASSTGDKLTILSSMADAWGSYGMTDANQSFDIAVADAKDVNNFVDTQFLLQLTFSFGETNSSTNKADLTLGVWINGESCGTQTFTGCNMGVFGNYMGLYRQSDESTIIVGSVGAEFPTDPGIQPSGRYEKVTYTQFGIADGEYTDVKGALKDETSVAGHVLCGDIQLKITGAQYTQIVLGGKEEYAGWSGIRLLTNTSDSFNVMWYDDQAKGKYVTSLTPSLAKVDFNGEEFNLMMSTEIVEHDGDGNADDIKLGIWFNGVLYNNTYIYINNKGPALGNYFLVSSEQAFLNADPELSKLPNKNFDKVTFSDFGLESDVCTQAEGMVKSTAKEYPTLDKVVFSGDFRLSDTGSYQIIYGGNSDWNGFRMIVDSNGTATLGWYRYNSETAKDDVQISAIINPADVGLTSFTKETFNFKISTELVDYDEDGEVNDIKLAIWFNDVLYPINGNEYSIVADWGGTLQNHFSVYQATAGTNVLLRNDAEYQANPYYYEDIASFRQDTGYTYPTLEGYVFSGWYEDEEYTTWIGADVTSGSAWAKFVEEDVLSAKPQVMVDSQTNKVTSNSTSLRFVTTVDSLEYRKISFYLQKQDGDEVDAANLSDENSRVVYEKLYYVGTTTGTMEYKPNAFSWQSQYFKTFTFIGIPESDYGVMIKATPFWVTMDGTIVRGKTLETCVNNYKPMGDNTSTAVSIDFIGDDVMPITGYFGPYTVSESSDPSLLPDYNTDTYFKMIADLGVNLIVHSNDNYATLPNATKKQLELGEKYGIGIFVNDSNILNKSETDMLAQIANYSSYKSFVGMHLADEPGTSDYCASSNNGLVSHYKDEATILNNNKILFYGNMYPILDAESAWWEGLFGAQGIDDTDKTAYKKYIDDYYSALNPTVLSYDFYPFSDTRINTDGTYNLDLYCWNLATIRDKAQATGKPFWAYVQAGSQWNDSKKYFDSKTPYYPNKAQFNWSANTALAFGAQGIQYFPLVQPYHFAWAGSSADDKMWDFERNGLIGAAGNKTEWYFYAQELNKHIAAIDNVLMNASSDKIIALGSTAQSDTSGLTDVVTTTSYTNPVSNEVVINNVTATGNALVGCFDYCGKTALYVVNYDFDNPGDVTLTFNEAKNITRIENAVSTETSASSLTLNMEAGEGILLVVE